MHGIQIGCVYSILLCLTAKSCIDQTPICNRFGRLCVLCLYNYICLYLAGGPSFRFFVNIICNWNDPWSHKISSRFESEVTRKSDVKKVYQQQRQRRRPERMWWDECVFRGWISEMETFYSCLLSVSRSSLTIEEEKETQKVYLLLNKQFPSSFCGDTQ